MDPTDFEKPEREVFQTFIHCSASDIPAHDRAEAVRQWHQARGWSDIGYHYFIRKDGTLEAGRNLEQIPAAQRGHNAGSLAICLSGGQDGADSFTPAQRATLVSLCRAINVAYGGVMRFRGHNEVANKLCPVFDYRGWLNLDAQGFVRPPAAPPKPLGESRTLRGGRWAVLGTVLTPLLDALADADTMLRGLPEVARALTWVALMLALGGLALVLWARLDDQLKVEGDKES